MFSVYHLLGFNDMGQLIDLYNKFLSFFPDPWHPWISVAIIIIMIMLVLRHWKTGVLGIILLIIFVPSSIPVLQNIAEALLSFVRH